MLKTILVPLDGSELAEQAVIYATAWQSQPLPVCSGAASNVSSTGRSVDGRERKDGALTEAEQYLQRMSDELARANSPVSRWCAP
jgi:hypothetical protein